VCGPQMGTVETFDKEVGLGEVRAGDGRLYRFHCTEIADGSRDIAAGADVAFVLGAGHRGTWEARALVSSR
jgi:cold shock CspA family protein